MLRADYCEQPVKTTQSYMSRKESRNAAQKLDLRGEMNPRVSQNWNVSISLLTTRVFLSLYLRQHMKFNARGTMT